MGFAILQPARKPHEYWSRGALSLYIYKAHQKKPSKQTGIA